MATSFAEASDLAARWRTLSTAESARADVLLGDASAIIRSMLPGIDADIDAGTMDPDVPKAVACSMVKRAMQGPTDLDGVTQQQQTAGPFSQGVTFSNPSGDLFLTKNEKQRLGLMSGISSVKFVGERYSMIDLLASSESSSSS